MPGRHLLREVSQILKPVGQAPRPNSSLLPHPLLPELETLASSTATEYGFALCGVHLHTHLIPMTMQVQIAQQGGGDVSLEDCARFSHPMSEALESSELINEAYVLEISSPGIGEQLLNDRDFKTFRGFPIQIVTRNESQAEISTEGLLLERSNDHVLINIKGRIKEIPRDDVISVRLTSPPG